MLAKLATPTRAIQIEATVAPKTFETYLKNSRREQPEWKPPKRLLALDPGGTTGWSLFVDGKLVRGGQCPGRAYILAKLIKDQFPTDVVIERYILYGNKTQEQIGSDMPVSQLIGVVKYVCQLSRIPVVMQGAGDVKKFCSDSRLKEWKWFSPTKRHLNDSIRHGCYCLLFHDRKTGRVENLEGRVENLEG